MLTLMAMTTEAFQQYLEVAVIDYAADKVKSGTWQENNAHELAIQSYNQLLPKGIDTPNHYLYSICLKEKLIGHTWMFFNSLEQTAFIYDIHIFEGYQNQGYGTSVMTILEEYAQKLGAQKLSLHVFGYNQRALHVYQKVGYHITDYNLSKEL
ncbi:hypothetical protein DOK78_001326 [Enterococcus sp. DIV2402]|uniref:N-acetyltransferase domain-containing protein n=1 Tax=Candidatus Enterococcus lowellii TaxID=2230877 RepID=A0ABZ2SMH3_9ENTE|nr:GNAT family N-acetyltransferase [Enterococcus sp. DIV2402]MBO0464481.1 GNAT family N-acetyltransferase [Enterococcus sp. DIV2402]